MVAEIKKKAREIWTCPPVFSLSSAVSGKIVWTKICQIMRAEEEFGESLQEYNYKTLFKQ